MLKHYFAIAIRNLLKYKTQTILSIIGLAVGFTCFSLSMFWLQYENSFDDFHSKADRIYVLQHIDSSKLLNVNRITFYPLAKELKASHPEIEEITNTAQDIVLVNTGNGPEWLLGLQIDTCFSKIFDLSNKNLRMPYYYGDNNSSRVPMPEKDLPIVISSNAAKKLFPNESSLGKEVKLFNENTYRVEGEVLPWPENTNIRFDFFMPFPVVDSKNIMMYHTYVLLKPGTDINALNEKLKNVEGGVILSPLKTFKTDYPAHDKVIKIDYIRLFALSGLLVAFCALFNYIMLFISRIRMRGRELALRKVNGASGRDLLLLLYAEFTLILICTLILGYSLIYLLLPEFKELSGINLPSSVVYIQALKYILSLTIVILLISSLPIYYYQRKTLYSSIYKASSNKDNNLFYKVCVSLQMIVSIGFIFCTLVLAKQVNHLTNRDIGFDKHRVARVGTKWKFKNLMPYADQIAQLPAVEDLLKHNEIMIWSWARGFNSSQTGDGKPVKYETYDITPHFIEFFDIKILEGINFDPEKINSEEILVNEKFVNESGLDNPVGKQINNRKIIGVVKDFYVENPEIPVAPIMISQIAEASYAFVYRYEEGKKKETEEAISRIIHKDDPDIEIEFSYMEDTYKDYYSSENALLKILAVTTLVCIIISVFGIYSMVTLICTKRRKEIAIRKVNGANVRSVLSNLIKEYLVLLIIASILIFPVVYKVMSLWLENYVNRVEVDIWSYILIITGLAIMVTATVFSQVWRAANQNPAEVLKSE